MSRHVIYTRYKEEQKPKCVLLCQHGDDGSKLLARYPDFHERCKIPRELLTTYLAVERDFGTSELVHEIAKRTNCSVTVIEIELHRGIIDPNRGIEKAVQNLFVHSENLELVAQLREAHREALEDVNSILLELKPAVLLDIHSMSPYTPKTDAESKVRAVRLEPGEVESYLDAWLNPARRGERRFVDIVTQLVDGTVVANQKLADTLAGRFTGWGIPYRFNHPYPTAPEVMSTSYMRDYPGTSGATIDIPKDYLADGTLDALKLNSLKINTMAAAIASAINEFVGTISK